MGHALHVAVTMLGALAMLVAVGAIGLAALCGLIYWSIDKTMGRNH